MSVGQRQVAALVLILAPLVVAATDPRGDVAPCPRPSGGVGGLAPDLISARGQIVELGTSAVWTLRFADWLRIPDDVGRPFRIDLVIRDPSAPVVRFAYYRGLNRLVRYDAVREPMLEILLLPERGQNVFLPPAIDGNAMTVQVPGRILSADEDETGTSPGIAQVRWSVIVRDGSSCDLLGNGRPSEPMAAVAEPSPVAPSAAPPSSEDPRSGRDGAPLWIAVAAGAVVVIGGLAYAVSRRNAR